MILQVVSYNVRSFRAGVDEAVEALGERRPDIVLLQECGRRSAVRRFGRSTSLDLATSHGLLGSVRNAVLHPPEWRVARADRVRLGREGRTAPRGFLVVQLRRGPVRLSAVSTHLGLSPRERERQARELTDWVAGMEGPVVIGADLNEGPEESAARWIGERLYDAFAVRGVGPGETFPARSPTARIDYLFVSEGVGVRGCKVEDSPASARASDHRPVLAELEIEDG